LLHESGHALGLAADSLPDGSEHPNRQPDSGPHCLALNNGCVMYRDSSPSTVFCEDCADSIRGRNLSSLPVTHDAGY
jgi:hypothetical protein